MDNRISRITDMINAKQYSDTSNYRVSSSPAEDKISTSDVQGTVQQSVLFLPKCVAFLEIINSAQKEN